MKSKSKSVMMAMMKRYLFVLLVLISSGLAAQPDFKDVYKSLEGNDRFSNMIALLEYQQFNHEHAICYFLLGEIYDKYMRETNPIVMLDFIQTNYNELKTNYGLAKFKLDESQARKDKEYYGDIKITTDKKSVTAPDISNEIDNRLAAAEIYYYDAVNVHDNYFRCIKKYNECLFKYREILKFNPNYNDLYLMVTDGLIADVQGIANNFDSVTTYFDAYQKSCALLPHLLKVNQDHLNTITTYRLEGLVEADFTLPVVELWNFKEWAESFLKVVENDILTIQKGMIDVDDRLNQQMSKLKEEVYGDNLSVYKPEDKFLNLIGKYDYSSIAKELFEYKKAKVDYLAMSRRDINNPTDSTAEFMINRLRYFKELAFQKIELNSKADQLKNSVSVDAMGKYGNFFDSRYRGLDGFLRWCDVDKYDNDKILKANLSHIPVFVNLEKYSDPQADSVILYGKRKLTFGVQKPSFDSIWTDTTFTTQLVNFKRNWHFIWGVEYNKKHVMSSFLSKIDYTGKVVWFTKPTFPVKDTIISANPFFWRIFGDSTGITLYNVLSRNGLNNASQCFLVKNDWGGKIIQQVQLAQGATPRYFYIDEINENYLLVTKGKQQVNDTQSLDTISVLLADFTGKPIWEKKFLMKGNFVDIVHTNSNFLITYNAGYFSTIDQKTVLVNEQPEKGASLVGLYINRDGTVKSGYTYSMEGDINVDLSQKITSNLINMVGKCKMNNAEEIFYLLIDPEGTPVFSTSENIVFMRTDF